MRFGEIRRDGMAVALGETEIGRKARKARKSEGDKWTVREER